MRLTLNKKKGGDGLKKIRTNIEGVHGVKLKTFHKVISENLVVCPKSREAFFQVHAPLVYEREQPKM